MITECVSGRGMCKVWVPYEAPWKQGWCQCDCGLRGLAGQEADITAQGIVSSDSWEVSSQSPEMLEQQTWPRESWGLSCFHLPFSHCDFPLLPAQNPTSALWRETEKAMMLCTQETYIPSPKRASCWHRPLPPRSSWCKWRGRLENEWKQ